MIQQAEGIYLFWLWEIFKYFFRASRCCIYIITNDLLESSDLQVISLSIVLPQILGIDNEYQHYYRQLGQYLDHVDGRRHILCLFELFKATMHPSIDFHFRSGVYPRVGICNLILNLMPSKLMTIVELFGYKGDRKLIDESWWMELSLKSALVSCLLTVFKTKYTHMLE